MLASVLSFFHFSFLLVTNKKTRSVAGGGESAWSYQAFFLVPNVARRWVGIGHGLASGQIGESALWLPTMPSRCDVPHTQLDMTMRFSNKKPALGGVGFHAYIE